MPPQEGICKRNTQNIREIVQNREKRAKGFLIEHVPTNVGQAHGNGRLAGGKREVSKQFKCHTSKKGKTHYHSMNSQCLTGMLISLYVPKTMNKYTENRTIIISVLKTRRNKEQKHNIPCNNLMS